MSKDDILFSKAPDLGRLTLAIIEHIVEPVVGENAIKIIGEPKEKQILYEKLCDALKNAEKKYIGAVPKSDIAIGTIQLPLANLKSIQQAFWHFVEVPDSHAFRRVLYKQLSSEYASFSEEERRLAADKYLQILKLEIIDINEEIRQKLSTAALLSIDNTLNSIDDGVKQINNGIAQIAQLLATLTSQDKREIGSSLRAMSKTSLPAQTQFELSLQEEMAGLETSDVDNLRHIIAEWFSPTIEEKLSSQDFYLPYGEVIYSIVRNERLSEQRKNALRRIFNSDLVKQVPHDDIKNEAVSRNRNSLSANIKGVYLKSLSRQFPSESSFSEPLGFYLVAEETVFGGINFDILCVADKKQADKWNQPKHGDNQRTWLEQTREKIKNISRSQRRYFVYEIFFTENRVNFRCKPDRFFSMDITHNHFSTFLVSFAEDFLSMASYSLLAERNSINSINKLHSKSQSGN